VTATSTPQPSRLIGLDGLRGLLALCVIVTHVTADLTPGVLLLTRVEFLGQAIVVFFAMSGFLIYRPFMTRLIDGRPLPATLPYIRNRAFRVFPAYIVIFLIANFVLHAVFVDNAMQSIVAGTDAGTGTITGPVEVLLQLSLLQNYLPDFLQTGINSSWTLTVELAFYVLLPVLAFAASRMRGTRARHPYVTALLPALFLLALGVICRSIGAFLVAADPSSDPLSSEWGATGMAVFSRSILVWSDTFAFGMIAAVIVAAARSGVLTRVGRMPLRGASVLLVVVGLAATAASVKLETRLIGTFVGLATVGILLLVVLPRAGGSAPRLATALDFLPLRYLGTISLSIYLWHYPVLIVYTRLGVLGPDTLWGALVNFVLVSVVSIVLASITYWLIELPALSWRPRRREAGAVPTEPAERQA
jgi:peptidoglycan/LPS O-acetylase OafA/YrhL